MTHLTYINDARRGDCIISVIIATSFQHFRTEVDDFDVSRAAAPVDGSVLDDPPAAEAVGVDGVVRPALGRSGDGRHRSNRRSNGMVSVTVTDVRRRSRPVVTGTSRTRGDGRRDDRSVTAAVTSAAAAAGVAGGGRQGGAVDAARTGSDDENQRQNEAGDEKMVTDATVARRRTATTRSTRLVRHLRNR